MALSEKLLPMDALVVSTCESVKRPERHAVTAVMIKAAMVIFSTGTAERRAAFSLEPAARR